MGTRSPAEASPWLVVAVLLVTALAVPASTAIAVPSGEAAQSGGASGAATAQVGSACDYTGLYDEAIDSVVLVSREGGQGTGFVYRSAGGNDTSYVLTNQHVVGQAPTVTVRFREGEFETGTVVGRDAFADLAVVEVDGTPDYADPLPVADSVPRPGRPVAAIGSPFGLRGSITHGIVSGVNRSMPTNRGFTVPDVIQTDAPINPGNSGGPLLTCDGRVVGVNTAGIQAARADNVGFAVSAPLIHRVGPDLIADGEVEWSYLGIRTLDVTPAIARANDLERARGVAVVETIPGGPADGALEGSDEIRTRDGRPVPVGGDVVVAIDGHRVATGEDLSSYLATEVEPGDTVTLAVHRDGERRRVDVTLGERPQPQADGETTGPHPSPGSGSGPGGGPGG